MRTSLLRQAISQISGDACTTFAGVPGLFEPKDWSKLAQAAVERCTGLLNKVTTSVPSSETVLDLDEMSDVLCQVLDAAEFCRNVHSDASWRSAAEQTCVKLSGFVHELNTNFALYTALKSAILGTSKTINGSSSWDSETRLVARMLLRDFERYGVHLEGTTRDTMTNLVAQHQLVGYEFGHNAADPKFCGQLTLQGASARRISQLPSALQKVFSGTRHGSKAGILTAPGQSSTLFGIMAFAEEESLRKAAYDLYNSTPSNNRSLLARLLEIRQEIANIMGYPSYAAYQLHGASLAGNPSAVTEFLQRLSKDSNEKAAEEIEELRVSVMQSGKDLVEKSTMFPGRLAAWDKDWSINKAMNNSREMDRLAILNNGLFTLDGCLAAMNEVFSKTMGIVLREVEPQRNETWARGVRKLLVESKLDGFLGCIYFDPFRRSRKFPGAAHFTLRCGRAARGTGSYQTPVVAVVTNFHSLDSTLSFSDVETIFHEFGHALNSVLSRTRFQHLSGR